MASSLSSLLLLSFTWLSMTLSDSVPPVAATLRWVSSSVASSVSVSEPASTVGRAGVCPLLSLYAVLRGAVVAGGRPLRRVVEVDVEGFFLCTAFRFARVRGTVGAVGTASCRLRVVRGIALRVRRRWRVARDGQTTSRGRSTTADFSRDQRRASAEPPQHFLHTHACNDQYGATNA